MIPPNTPLPALEVPGDSMRVPSLEVLACQPSLFIVTPEFSLLMVLPWLTWYMNPRNLVRRSTKVNDLFLFVLIYILKVLMAPSILYHVEEYFCWI